jgi:hypothetical protein
MKYTSDRKYRTDMEEIHSSTISSNVKVFVQETTVSKSELGEVVPAIIPQKDEAIWFKHLTTSIEIRQGKIVCRECIQCGYC